MSSHNYFLSESAPRMEKARLEAIVRKALIEDIGRGDITSKLTISQDKEIKAVILVKEDCFICGLEAAEMAFKIVDKKISFKPLSKDGRRVKKNKVIIELCGNARNILTAERVALNLLSMMSAVATKTKEYVAQIEPYKTKITDTRKTMPGLRELQKYAVRVGGGYNHRMGLDEMILIKDNHIKVSEGYDKLPSVPKGFKIEIEVQDLQEFRHALKFKPDVIMLDNMGLEDIKEAVKIRDNTPFRSHHPRTKIESSGSVNIKNVRKIAANGVDIISIGELTHSIKSIDISLEVL